MFWNQLTTAAFSRCKSLMIDLAGDLRLLADTSQLNRRARHALQLGQTTKACFYMADHQRRRITRRREIRRLVKGS